MRDEWEDGPLAFCRECGMELTGEEGLNRSVGGVFLEFCCRSCMGEYYQHREQPI